MTPVQIIALIRDVALAAALGWLVWRIYSDGENNIKKQDLEVVQKQLQDNTKLLARWHEQSVVAENQRKLDMDSIAGRIAAQREPIIVRQPGKTCTVSVPAVPGQAANADPGAGGIDIRPGINRFELKYEKALADCRAAIAQWPN